MRITTWNINSVRFRLDLVRQVVGELQPDVLCLQETKTPDEFFPMAEMQDLGFKYIKICGMKAYNGLAILSKHPLENFQIHERCGKSDCRHISADVHVDGYDQAIEVHNLYIPAGGYEPKPEINEKFQHKLDFVDELTKWFPENSSSDKPVVALGDMNIAPLENDVWSHKKMLKVVSHTPIEVEKFTQFYHSMNWVDAVRHFVPEEEKLYSWWSYRAKDWAAADKGRRLDHFWVTQSLKKHLKGYHIPREVRGAEKPSDHAPVCVDFDFSS